MDNKEGNITEQPTSSFVGIKETEPALDGSDDANLHSSQPVETLLPSGTTEVKEGFLSALSEMYASSSDSD